MSVRLQWLKRRIWRGFRRIDLALLTAIVVTMILPVSWMFHGAGALQPDRGEALAISLRPELPSEYDGAIALPLTVTAHNTPIGFWNYLGKRPKAVLLIRQSFLVAEVPDTPGFLLRLNVPFEYYAPTRCETDRKRMECEFDRKRSDGRSSIRIYPLPPLTAEEAPAAGAAAYQLNFTARVELDSFAVSREVEDGVPVDFSRLEWLGGEKHNWFRPTSLEESEVTTYAPSAVISAPFEHLQKQSESGAMVQLELCPSCMAVRAYGCANEVTKGTYVCTGDRSSRMVLDWSSYRVDFQWQRNAAMPALTGLLSLLLAIVVRREKIHKKLPEDGRGPAIKSMRRRAQLKKSER